MNARLLAMCAVAAVSVVGCGSPTGPSTSTSSPTTARPTTAPFTSAPPSTAAATPAPTSVTPTRRVTAPPTGRPGRMWSVVVTFYGAADNDPPGSTAIAYPNALHRTAGGTGTYANPLSLASDGHAIAVGTRVYYPPLQMYFVMEDDCASCIDEWESDRIPHIDLWTGNHLGEAFLACENALTPDGRVTVELNPPSGRPVDTRPLYGRSGCRV